MAFAPDEVRVHTLDETQLAGYRRVSLSAVLAAILGAASALALAHPLLWIIPPAAVVVAIFALRAISAEQSNLTGRWLAVMGLALALFFGCWAAAWHVSWQNHLYGQAREFADEWLELVRTGDLQQAHQLTLRGAERRPPNIPLDKLYEKNEHAKEGLQSFFHHKPLEALAAAGENVTYHYAGGDAVAPEEFNRRSVALRYDVECDPQYDCPSQIRVVLERSKVGETDQYLWRVTSIDDPRNL